MQIKETLKPVLRTRHYLIVNNENSRSNQSVAYLNAFLLSNFGIIVDKPALLTQDMLRQIDEEFHLDIPDSFYKNPQDTSHFTTSELLTEQIVSYFAYGSDIGRIDIFKKDLPDYVIGDELKLRTFYIITEEEAAKVLTDIMNSYCAYTRPFSIDEYSEFMLLFKEGFYTGIEIMCKDNIFSLLDIDPAFAHFLDKKDIVKLSIQKFGDNASFKAFKTNPILYSEMKKFLDDVAAYIPYVKHCPMSKKQAKYYNKIISLCGLSVVKATNAQSPDRRALKMLNEGNVVAAANIYAENGSMLERRLKMLLSRANPKEAIEILDMLPAKNPLVLFQTINNIIADNGESRTFTFYHDNVVKTHRETEYETAWRKSKLNESTRRLLEETCIEKIKEYYRSLPSLGKVYIADNFYKLGLPTNTSASGKGIDVLPIGSRVPCTGSSIRTFVHWKNAFDIDSSLIVVDSLGELHTIGWFSYASKPFGNAILFSGDITGSNGAEFYDINLDVLASNGYKYVVQTFHGYNSKLDSGEIYAGYQNKENLKTKTWDPKNIEMQFRVQGDSRGCVAFAIDLETREIIILNQIIDSDERVVNPAGFKTIERYLNSKYLTINIGMLAECCGEVITDPAKADVVFDDTYVQDFIDGDNLLRQDIIRSYETEKLVAFVNK